MTGPARVVRVTTGKASALYCRDCGDKLTDEPGRLCSRCRWDARQDRIREDEARYDYDDAREDDDYR